VPDRRQGAERFNGRELLRLSRTSPPAAVHTGRHGIVEPADQSVGRVGAAGSEPATARVYRACETSHDASTCNDGRAGIHLLSPEPVVADDPCHDGVTVARVARCPVALPAPRPRSPAPDAFDATFRSSSACGRPCPRRHPIEARTELEPPVPRGVGCSPMTWTGSRVRKRPNSTHAGRCHSGRSWTGTCTAAPYLPGDHGPVTSRPVPVTRHQRVPGSPPTVAAPSRRARRRLGSQGRIPRVRTVCRHSRGRRDPTLTSCPSSPVRRQTLSNQPPMSAWTPPSSTTGTCVACQEAGEWTFSSRVGMACPLGVVCQGWWRARPTGRSTSPSCPDRRAARRR
jgi:hypothetical protein